MENKRTFTLNDPIDEVYSKGKNNTSYLRESSFGVVSEEEKEEARNFLRSTGHTNF